MRMTDEDLQEFDNLLYKCSTSRDTHTFSVTRAQLKAFVHKMMRKAADKANDVFIRDMVEETKRLNE